MFAETVHTIFQSLSKDEQERFFKMVELPTNKKKTKKVSVPSVENYIDKVYKIMVRNKKKNSGNHPAIQPFKTKNH